MDKKRIATNTIFLYIRMCIMLLVSLLASRLLLRNLGVIDYGVYNVVYGLVLFFSFMKGTLTSGSQRFLNYAMGREDDKELGYIFRAAFSNHLIIASVVLFIVLIVGNILIANILDLPDNRYTQAYLLFNTAALSLFITIISVPFEAVLIAHENMKSYAIYSIIDSILKLIAAFSLIIIAEGSRISLYGFFLLLISVIDLILYYRCAKSRYTEVICKYYWNKHVNLEMIFFSGWDTLGWGASACAGQGVNVLLNIFGGPLLNAARGVSIQVHSLLNQLVNSYQNAINPQIVKTYAKGQLSETSYLICVSSKYSLVLASVIAIPLLLEMESVLQFWLGEVPPWSVPFSQIMVIQSLIVGFTRPIVNGVHATGKIKMPCIFSSLVLFLILPLSWYLLKIGIAPTVVLITNLFPWIIEGIINLFFLNKYIGVKYYLFALDVLLRPLLAFGIAFFICEYISSEISFDGIYKVLFIALSSVIVLTILTLIIVMKRTERKAIFKMCHHIIKLQKILD